MRAIPVTLVASLCVVTAVAQEQRPTFKATARTVEVSVVVTDGVREPVTGLTRDDFVLTENRTVQAISVFQANDTRGVASSGTLPGTGDEAPRFSNRIYDPGATTTVILLDRLNAAFDSQWFARKHIDDYLSRVRTGDRTALYVLDGSLRVLHDFTSDTASLRRTLDRYAVWVTGAYAASKELPPELSNPGDRTTWLSNPADSVAEFFFQRRTHDTFSSLELLGRHLSGIGGRKNLVWVSEVFSIPTGLNRPVFMAELRSAMRSLNDAQVALYPVDARGLVGAVTMSSGKASMTTFAQVRGNIETMEKLADDTGGRAYANTNALGASIRRAVDDGRVTYLLGYQPANATLDGTYRSIDVRVKRKGVTVRHRQGYTASTPVTNAAGREAALRDALHGPLSATMIGLTADTRYEPNTGELALNVRIYPATVRLERDGDVWKGQVDFIVAEVNQGGKGSVLASRKLELAIPSAQRAEADLAGLPVSFTLRPKPALLQLRVVARDVATGHVGSLVMPALELRR